MKPYMATQASAQVDRSYLAGNLHAPDEQQEPRLFVPGERANTLEENDVLYVWRQTRAKGFKYCDVQRFVTQEEGKALLAERAPILQGLLDGTHIPDDAYEWVLEKKLCCRAWMEGTIDEAKRQENRDQAWQDLFFGTYPVIEDEQDEEYNTDDYDDDWMDIE